MAPADYIRSTPFRIGSAYAATFALSVVVLFGVVYWLATDEMKSALRSAINQDVASLLNAYHEHGKSGLREAIEDRISDARDQSSLYILLDENGDLRSGVGLEGNLTTGWQESRLRSGTSARDGEAVPETFLVRGVETAGSFFAVGRSLYALTEVQEVLYRSLALALVLTVIIAIAAGIGLGHGAVRRIDEINQIFQNIMAGDLARRIPTKGTGDELDRLVLNINDMLDRIEQLMANLQQVTNDIAHDLRTPLSRLRQDLEAVRMRESSVEDYQSMIGRAIERTDTILETFSALLRIAQIESRVRRGRFAAVDLSEISNRVVEAYQSAVEDVGQTLSANISPGIQVRGDKDLLTQVLANLIENAMRHCPAGTEIIVTLANGTTPSLSVADSGPGIPPASRELVLRRFYRLEESRTTSGSGLGLALVKAVAALHSATLTLSDNRPGLLVSLRFDAGSARWPASFSTQMSR